MTVALSILDRLRDFAEDWRKVSLPPKIAFCFSLFAVAFNAFALYHEHSAKAAGDQGAALGGPASLAGRVPGEVVQVDEGAEDVRGPSVLQFDGDGERAAEERRGAGNDVDLGGLARTKGEREARAGVVPQELAGRKEDSRGADGEGAAPDVRDEERPEDVPEAGRRSCVVDGEGERGARMDGVDLPPKREGAQGERDDGNAKGSNVHARETTTTPATAQAQEGATR